MSKMCTIYLVRHGHTEWNNLGLLQGHSDSPLTLDGMNQVKTRAQELKHIHFSAVYSSDLGRACTTARLLVENHKLAVITNELLREIRFGRMEGKKWADVQQELKEELIKREQMVKTERVKHKFFPEMESDEEGVYRLITFLRQVAYAHLKQNILVVSHGGIMRAFLIHLGYATYQELPGNSISNTGYVVLESDGVDFFINQTVGITKAS